MSKHTPVDQAAEVRLMTRVYGPIMLDALRALLSPRHYDKGMDCYVIQAKSDEAKAALELLNKIGGSDENE